MTFCTCKEPKLKTNEAYGKSFKVCSKSLGGCGCEYLEPVWKEHASSGDIFSGIDMIPISGRSSTVRGPIIDEWDDDVPF